jgi:hypothetical protein
MVHHHYPCLSEFEWPFAGLYLMFKHHIKKNAIRKRRDPREPLVRQQVPLASQVITEP